MKATEAKLLGFLKKSPQFVIPIYQRTYSWNISECEQLWNDIIRTGANAEVASHFVGSIVYVEKGLYQVSSQSPLLVIDGQQRLTTLTLLLAALAESLDDLSGDQQEPVDGFSTRKIRNYYLLNPEESGERHYKLLLSQTDKDTLTAIVGNKPQPKDRSVRVLENYQYFQKLITTHKNDIVTICNGLAKLVIVDVALNRDQDNPQLIFESMNSTGRELTQADLIRNFILMGLEPKIQTELYENYWRPMEIAFGQEAYTTSFDGFMRHYLTVKTNEIPNIREVYEAFKNYARTPSVAAAGVSALVADIHDFAKYYCAMALGAEQDADLAHAFRDLRELRVDVAYPFLLDVYHDYAQKQILQADVARIVRIVEAYVFRRAICAIPTNSMNKTFANLLKNIKKDQYVEQIQAQLMALPSYRRFPTDDEFRRDLQTRDLYNFRSRSYMLRRLENHNRKEPVPVDEYTIEHIMPQNETLSASWQAALGSDWARVQQTWLHTLGNLTLTGYNSEYSDRPFAEKRDMVGGFKDSPLRLNNGLGQTETWDETAIHTRAERLAQIAQEVWQAPHLPAGIVTAPITSARGATYTLEHYRQLNDGPVRAIFDAFRKEVLALDPCVTEEMLKVYIAYKAETNVVDVVPQEKRLRLSLNMPFAEIRDPKGICKDVSNLGRWGNGEVEVILSTMDELPYIMSLVRQSLERQLGNGGAE